MGMRMYEIAWTDGKGGTVRAAYIKFTGLIEVVVRDGDGKESDRFTAPVLNRDAMKELACLVQPLIDGHRGADSEVQEVLDRLRWLVPA